MATVAQENSLAVLNPELAKEWHPTMNALDASQVTPGSSKKAWWKCQQGHEWEAAISSRNTGVGCPYCSGLKTSPENSLKALNPKLATEWHPSKNSLNASQVSPGSSKKVWWKCSKGHEWQAVIKSRNNGRGCPYCSGKKINAENSLKALNPDLASEWHPTKNGSLSPDEVAPKSGCKVWWFCHNGHEWKAQINNRANGAGCPACIGRMATKDNCLASLNPSLAKEWHPTKNGKLTPQKLTRGSKVKVWWECSEGHEWQATVNSRNAGNGCPVCAGKKVHADNCLANLSPSLSSEWHPTKNGKLTPARVTVGSRKKVWWICKKDHIWQASVGDRSRGSGCPMCRSATSIAELRIYTELSALFPSVLHRYKVDGIECDIFIEDYNLAIEYDGLYWHKGKKKKDLKKNSLLSQKGITLIRVRDAGLPALSDVDLILPVTEIEFQHIVQLVEKLITILNVPSDVRTQLENYCARNDYANEDRFTECLEYLGNALPWNNLAVLSPETASKWNHKRNGKLKPQDVTTASHLKLWWICELGHEWQSPVDRMAKLKHGCPYCDGKMVAPENSLATKKPEVAESWNYERNEDLTPADVTYGSKRKVWWKCKEGHEWQATVNGRTQGFGCPYCDGKKVSPENSLAKLNPELSKEWHPTKNKSLTPSDVLTRSSKRVWWQCSKGHEWQAPVSDRNNGTRCPYCTGRRPHSKNNFQESRPEIAKEWHPTKNGTKLPSEFSPRSHKKAWWVCPKGHEYEASFDKRYMGRGCPVCAGKRPPS